MEPVAPLGHIIIIPSQPVFASPTPKFGVFGEKQQIHKCTIYLMKVIPDTRRVQ